MKYPLAFDPFLPIFLNKRDKEMGEERKTIRELHQRQKCISHFSEKFKKNPT